MKYTKNNLYKRKLLYFVGIVALMIFTVILPLNSIGISAEKSEEIKEEKNEISDEEDPFWAYEMKKERPSGGIHSVIFLGSGHYIPYLLLPKKLRKSLEKANILVEEIEKDFSDRNYLTTMKESAKLFSRIANLLSNNFVLNTIDFPILLDKNLDAPLAKDWAKNLNENIQNDLTAVFMVNSWITGKNELSSVHPYSVLALLNYTEKSRRHLFGIDTTLQKKFAAARKPVYGLETNESRINDAPVTMSRFVNFKDLNHNQLLTILKNKERMDSLLSKIRELYEKIRTLEQRSAKGNQEAFYNSQSNVNIRNMFDKYKNNGLQGFSPKKSNDVIERNKQWMPKLKTILKKHFKDRILVVVGAAHLTTSEGSLLKFMEDEGYSVEKFRGDDVSE